MPEDKINKNNNKNKNKSWCRLWHRLEEVKMTKEQKKEKIKKIYSALFNEYKSRAVAVKRTAKLTGVTVATVAFLTSQY